MTAPASDRLDELFAGIASGFRSRGLAPLLSLHGADPFARQELARLVRRDASLAERIRTGFAESALARPEHEPLTARDVIDFYGFRAIHCQTAGNAISDVIGRAHVHPQTHDFWEWAFICSTLAGVLTEKLGRHEDEAFAACFIRCAALRVLRDDQPDLALRGLERAQADALLLWEGERLAIGGSHLDLARHLACEWRLPEVFLPAFDDDRDPESFAGLILRAMAAAQRHGFVDPEGMPLPARFVPEREAILDAFARRTGGPEALPVRVRSMLSTARVPLG